MLYSHVTCYWFAKKVRQYICFFVFFSVNVYLYILSQIGCKVMMGQLFGLFLILNLCGRYFNIIHISVYAP